MPGAGSLLIRNVDAYGAGPCDVLIVKGRVAGMGQKLKAPKGIERINGAGGALLPGLKDHHLHLASLAAARDSLPCGPPEVEEAQVLTERLQTRVEEKPGQWVRGIGYHDSVAGDIDAAWLDERVNDCPVRIQHRGGRLWVFNTLALERLQAGENDPLQRIDGRLTGRLYEGDVWLRERMRALNEAALPDLGAASRELAGYGITGITDTTPHNGPDNLQWFHAARHGGELLQDILVMGDWRLDEARLPEEEGVSVGPHKFHLLESELPDLDEVCAAIRQSHAAARHAAFHCVTRTELVFALAALHEAGTLAGDRIEHASVTPPDLLQAISGLGLAVVTQPGFVYDRGDQYLEEVDADDQPWLYRLKGFVDAGVPLAGSSDAPFSSPDPWRAMQAATTRRTRSGRAIGTHEALAPEQALALYTAPLHDPGRPVTRLATGMAADLCLLKQPWDMVRTDLSTARVRMTVRSGSPIWSG